MKTVIEQEIQINSGEITKIATYLYENPETGGQETLAQKFLVGMLEEHGYSVEVGFCEIPTSFRAVLDSGKPGANIGLMCEYDALPDIGHGCGHNMIAAITIGAAIALKKAVFQTGGKVTVFGTPAEETNGAKVKMAEDGAFDDLTVAMMVHPNPITESSGSSLALNALRFRYHGQAAHAAAAPEKGINALDGVLLLFQGINALRQHVTSDVRIHGIITKGGVAPNIVPDFAEALFYVRAAKTDNLKEVVAKVLNCAKGAASATGTTYEVEPFESPYDNLKTNRVLSDCFDANLTSLGEKQINPPGEGIGSIDMGNVSHVTPSIHPWLGLNDKALVLHTKEFADRTISKQGEETMMRGAFALALTAWDVLSSTDLQAKIKKEFVSI